MNDKVWNLSSLDGAQIQPSGGTLQNLFVIALYLAGIYFSIAASRRHIKETLKSGEKVGIKFFWQHFASILLLAMPFFIFSLPNRFSSSAAASMGADNANDLNGVVLITVIMLLTQVAAFVIIGWNQWKKEKGTKDESGDAKP